MSDSIYLQAVRPLALSEGTVVAYHFGYHAGSATGTYSAGIDWLDGTGVLLTGGHQTLWTGAPAIGDQTTNGQVPALTGARQARAWVGYAGTGSAGTLWWDVPILKPAWDTPDLKPLAVNSSILAANAVTTAKIASGAVGTGQLALLAVDSTILAVGAVTTAKIAANAMDNTKLAAGTALANIGTGGISSGYIANGAVGTTQLALLAVDSTILAAGAVTTAKIAAGAVGTTQLALLAVNSTILAAGAVTTAKIAAGAVGTTQLALLAVDSTILATGAVTTAKIATGAVTPDQLGASAVLPSKVSLGIYGMFNASAEIGNSAGTFADGWTSAGTVAWNLDVSGTFTADGVHSFKLGTVAGTHWVESPLALLPGAANGGYPFRVNAWARFSVLNNNLSSLGGDGMVAEIRQYDRNGTYISSTSFVDEAGQTLPPVAGLLTRYSAAFAVTLATTFVSIRVTVTVGAGRTTFAYVDKFCLDPANAELSTGPIYLRTAAGAVFGIIDDGGLPTAAATFHGPGWGGTPTMPFIFREQIAAAQWGTLNIGGGPFDLTASGRFGLVGNSAGTLLAINTTSGLTADLARWAVFGVSKFAVDSGGGLTAYGSLRSPKLIFTSTSNTSLLTTVAGTSFAGSPSTDDETIRTDLSHRKYYYPGSGTNWYSTHAYALGVFSYQGGAPPWAGATTPFAVGLPSTHGVFLTVFGGQVFVSSTQSIGNYWTITLYAVNNTSNTTVTLATLDSRTLAGGSAPPANIWTPVTAITSFANNPVLPASYGQLQISITPTGTPGTLYFIPALEGLEVR